MFKWCHLSLMAHKTEIIKHLLAGLYCGGCACCMCAPMGATTAAELQRCRLCGASCSWCWRQDGGIQVSSCVKCFQCVRQKSE